MKILLHGLNYAPEEIGIGKYSGEMIQWLAERGHECVVVTTPPYYPAWKIERPWKGGRYEREKKGSGFRVQSSGKDNGYEGSGDAGLSPGLESPTSPARRESETQRAASEWGRNEISGRPSPTAETVDFPRRRVNFENGTTESRGEEDRRAAIEVIRCPLWVPKKVTGLKRVIHLASFGLSCIPAVLWKAITFRPDVILTVEPAAMCMPTTWIASRICSAKCWLHVQDFEVDAAFDLGILKQPLLKKVVLALEGFLMRRFDRVSSISPNMMLKAAQKGVDEDRLIAFPNWVDCDLVYPIP
ncbi:MAG: glycosyltransferase, partial [Planctomycetota bacterium]